MMSVIYKELYNYMESMQVISSHSHHREDAFHTGLSLEELLKNSYVNWCGVSLDSSKESRRAYLDKVRYNSYFIWLEKALQKIYHFSEPIAEKNWDRISDMILQASNNSNHHLNLLKNACNYDKIILDAYWNPGSDNNHPEIFTPTFRINMFLYGYSKDACDHNGNNPIKLYRVNTDDIDGYISSIREIIIDKKNNGCVALKSALAYDRGLDFTEVSKERAQRALTKTKDPITSEDIKAFGDYVFFKICAIAAELDLPLQCHTGLGQLEKTNAMQMHEVIKKNPDTKFVLFHGGYPWLEDICALTHLYKNVYPDICWLPIISTSAAERMLEELLEISTIDRICWGCDTWTSEESLGALLAAKHVLAQVLTKKVSENYFSMDLAKEVINHVLYSNAKNLYHSN